MPRTLSREFGLLLVAIAACSHNSPPPKGPAWAAPGGTPGSAPGGAVDAVATTPTAPDSQAAPSTYNKPPKHVLDILHAPPSAQPYVSPTRDRILLVSNVHYPSIAQVAEPFLRLAACASSRARDAS